MLKPQLYQNVNNIKLNPLIKINNLSNTYSISSKKYSLLTKDCLLRKNLNSHFHQTTIKNANSRPIPKPVINRENIGIFGCMNAGKSTLMNLLTQSPTSIVDSKPGTTADVKIALMEIHKIGPCKIFDTAGYDEEGGLGEKKLNKTKNVAKESDLIILVIDKNNNDNYNEKNEKEIISLGERRNKRIISIINTREREPIKETTYRGYPALCINLADKSNFSKVIEFIQTKGLNKKKNSLPLLPLKLMGPENLVFMNIPMDAETPGSRLLRPQARCQEFCLSHFTSTYAFRMDLAKGRSSSETEKNAEKSRFQEAIKRSKPNVVITDSQAMDLVAKWLDPKLFPNVELTNFSTMMINETTNGQLRQFIKGLEAVENLKPGSKILISEACNHNRLTEICEDIGTKQIPEKLRKKLGKSIIIDHAFGREFPSEKLKEYSLVIHCGGCMIDKQKICARLEDCIENNIPITNYGLLLTYLNSPKALKRVIKPFI